MNAPHDEKAANARGGKRDYRQRIRPERKARLFLDIVEHITATLATRDTKYTAIRLAKDIDSNNRYIAAAISHCTGHSYSHLMTALRLRDVVSVMRDECYDDLSVEEIGLFCGFASRQSFYENFRLFFPSSPRAYRLNLRLARHRGKRAAEDPAAFIDLAVMAAAHFLRLRNERPDPTAMPYLRSVMGRNLNIPSRKIKQVAQLTATLATTGCMAPLSTKLPTDRRRARKSSLPEAESISGQPAPTQI